MRARSKSEQAIGRHNKAQSCAMRRHSRVWAERAAKGWAGKIEAKSEELGGSEKQISAGEASERW